jgi:hypothetical protein
MKKLVLAFLVIATGCAAFARERSPKPEAAQLTIKTTTDKIRALLLADFVAQGFTINNEVAGTTCRFPSRHERPIWFRPVAFCTALH